MARKRMTEAEERQAIADAVAARDDDTIPARADLTPGEAGTVVLSVRLPFDQARALRAIAASRRQPLSSLLTDAVQAVIATGGPQLMVGEGVKRLYVVGAGFDSGETLGTPVGPPMLSSSISSNEVEGATA